MDNLPFIEKYRPKEFSEVVGLDTKLYESIITNPKDMPNLLLYGTAGTGKTTIAKILLSKLSPVDILRVNGSDTTSVDFVRDQIYNFISSQSRIPDKPKIVWIEEFDYLSSNAMAALRTMIEQYMKNARFVCTSNTLLTRLPIELREAMLSRFSVIEFKKIEKIHVVLKLSQICNAEAIKAPPTCLLEIAKLNNGDIRASINALQTLSKVTKDIKMEDLKLLQSKTSDIYSMIVNKDWTKLRFDLPNMNIDYNKTLVELADLFFNSKEIDTSQKVVINEVISTGLVELNMSFSKEISFCATASRIMGQLR
jgi:DNA polymerase III delta prime subunit